MEMSESLRLQNLSPDETVSLVTARLGLPADGLPQAIADLVRQRAEGNPFFAEELVFTLRDQGIITIEPSPKSPRTVNRCFQSGDLDSHTLPDTLQGLILARIDQLPPAKQLTLKVAAVIGRSFAYTPLHYLLKQNTNMVEKTIQGHLTKLTEQELTLLEMPAPDLSYIFKHIITQEVAYQTLLFAQRRRLHRTVAEWYETTNPELAPVYPLLVYHYHHAEESAQERHYAKLAGEQAAKQFANAEAEHYISRALDLTPESDLEARYKLLLAREQVLDLQGKRESQLADLAALAALAERLHVKQKAEIALRQANYAQARSDYPLVITEAQKTITLSQAAGILEWQARGYLQWGRALIRLTDYNAARVQLKEALHLARTARTEGKALPIEADSLYNLGTTALEQNKHTEARDYLEQALLLYRALSVIQRGESRVLNNLGLLQRTQGDYRQARSYLEEALHLNHKTGDRLGESQTLNNLGVIALEQGDYPGAQRYLEQARKLQQEIDNRWGESIALLFLALLFHYLEDNQTAQTYSQQVLHISQSLSARHVEVYAFIFLGHTLVAQKRLDEAADAYQQALTLRRQSDAHNPAIEALAGLARVALACGKIAQAQEYTQKILAYLEINPSLEGAEEPMRIYLTCYRVLQASPTEGERAQEILHTAHRLLQERAAKISDEQMRRVFLRNVAVHREIGAAWEMIGEFTPPISPEKRVG
jgi:tetratricopeptide (TPR) repeat protein